RFFFSSRRRHTRLQGDWSSDVCSSDLDRENEPANVAGVYEFPRELGKLRKNLNQYLVELCKPSQLSANPYLRGFYFTGIRARIEIGRASCREECRARWAADH